MYAECSFHVAAECLTREGFQVFYMAAVGFLDRDDKGDQVEGPELDTQFPVFWRGGWFG
jgi:hypothetical protein